MKENEEYKEWKMNILDYLERSEERYKDKTAVTNGQVSMTWNELVTLARKAFEDYGKGNCGEPWCSDQIYPAFYGDFWNYGERPDWKSGAF